MICVMFSLQRFTPIIALKAVITDCKTLETCKNACLEFNFVLHACVYLNLIVQNNFYSSLLKVKFCNCTNIFRDKAIRMIYFPSGSYSSRLDSSATPTLRRTKSLSSISSDDITQGDVLDLSRGSLKSLEQAASMAELCGDFDAATPKYTLLLKNNLFKYGENSIETADARSKLIFMFLKANKPAEANYHIEHLRQSLTNGATHESKKAIRSILVNVEEAKKQAHQSWFKALEFKLTAKKDIHTALEQREQARKDEELQALRVKEQMLKIQARQMQKQKYADLVDDLKTLKIKEVDNLGFCSDVQIKKDYDEEDAELLLKFNHGERIQLSNLSDRLRLLLATNIEELLFKTPKKYDVTPATSGTQVKIKDVSELLPSQIFKHLIASKALIQWNKAATKDDQIAWARQIKDWFSEPPEYLEKQYSFDKSLYDLFMGSDQSKGLGSLAGMHDLKNYFLANVISPLFDTDNAQGYKGLILHGEPGNGKTALASALARHLGFNIYHIRRGDLETTYKNGVPETIAKTLKHARENKPSIVILEEVDSIAASRDGVQSNDGSDAKETTAIMNGIDQLIEDNSPVILLATTNFIHKLDKAFRREGRFHDEIEIHNPDQELREHLFKTYLKKFDNGESIAKKAAEISGGLTAAAIRTICEYDIGNDSKVQLRFRKSNDEMRNKTLDFEKLEAYIIKRKNNNGINL